MISNKKGSKACTTGCATKMQMPSTINLAGNEIVQSVQTLYADELKPYGRVLLKRLRERAAAKTAELHKLDPDAIDPETMPRIDPRRLRKACESCTSLCVEPEEGKEYSVKLVGQPNTSFDICSTEDPYPQEFWDELFSYLDGLSKESMMLPGGRYACARILVRRRLALLVGLSLGQVCHVVQLAISQRKFLGYLDGSLVPYKYSEGWIKEQCALNQSTTGTGALPVATWEEAHSLLQELLESETNPAPGMITISNVKRLFRSRFQLELSETVFGYTKLFDLLSDPFFHDVCTLQVRGNGQVLVKRTRNSPQTPPGVWGPFHLVMPVPMLHLPQEPYDSNAANPNTGTESWPLVSPGASPRGAPSEASSPTASPGAAKEERSPGGSNIDNGGASTAVRSSSSWSSSISTPRDDAEFEARSPSEDGLAVKNTFIDIPAQPDRPKRSRSMPKDLGSRMVAGAKESDVWSPRGASSTSSLMMQKQGCPQGAVAEAAELQAGSNDAMQGCGHGWWGASQTWWVQDQPGIFPAATFHTGPPGVWFAGMQGQQEIWVDQENMPLSVHASWSNEAMQRMP